MHPILALLAARARGARDDGATLALVIEGGGMRGVVSSAMAAALEGRGLTPCFDLVVGTSAGALNAAALLAGGGGAGPGPPYPGLSAPPVIQPHPLGVGGAGGGAGGGVW